ncbi:MAG: H+/Na+-translocating ferredoxin:NAD+ oxidoreductase subunit [Tepidanaerobacteraceae bacterium]|nr:H+/Na+-translocating ferredoxin:NAD+ oxidoreductase subunit [Tepidanaerobacteraceae bacterium]
MPDFGRGRGRGGGFGGGYGRGKEYGGGAGFGPDGTCVCQNCGYEMPHQRGAPCYTLRCLVCGGPMVRKDVVSMGGDILHHLPLLSQACHRREKRKLQVHYTSQA